MSLTDKIAVITGATGQLGPVVARVFGTNGAKLALCAASQDELTTLIAQLGYPESRVFAVARDVMDEAAARSLADAVIEHYGRVDILVHLIGGYQNSPIIGLETETWEYLLNLNLRTTVNVLRAFLPYITGNGWGRIITFSSVVAEKPTAQSAAYSAAKAAVEALTLSAAQEIKDHGATANVIVIKTLDMAEDRAQSQAAKATGKVTPEEVASLLIYLCSDEAAAINGARLPLYGRG